MLKYSVTQVNELQIFDTSDKNADSISHLLLGKIVHGA